MKIPIHQIKLDNRTQSRKTIDLIVIAEYTERMKAGDIFPPITVYEIEGEYIVVDGFHRIKAAEKAGCETIAAQIKNGTLPDAQWYSYGVNRVHGLMRSNEDKRRAVENALLHEKGAVKSDSEIARHVGVSDRTVNRIRHELVASSTLSKIDKREVTRNGKTFTQNTSNIGGIDSYEDAMSKAQNIDESTLTFQAGRIAYCKYCYQNHDNWALSDEHWPPAWMCMNCEHATADDFMMKHNNDYYANTKVGQAMIATTFSHNSLEYYTPLWIIELACSLMGSIDLDPASCDAAQSIVNASKYYTVNDDGLNQQWAGNVWLNPPYSKTEGKSNQSLWSEKMTAEYLQGNITQGILLVKAAIGYKWFTSLFKAWPCCLLHDRVSFILENGNDDGQSKQGTALFYFGEDIRLFNKIFSPYGKMVE